FRSTTRKNRVHESFSFAFADTSHRNKTPYSRQPVWPFVEEHKHYVSARSDVPNGSTAAYIDRYARIPTPASSEKRRRLDLAYGFSEISQERNAQQSRCQDRFCFVSPRADGIEENT